MFSEHRPWAYIGNTNSYVSMFKSIQSDLEPQVGPVNHLQYYKGLLEVAQPIRILSSNQILIFDL